MEPQAGEANPHGRARRPDVRRAWPGSFGEVHASGSRVRSNGLQEFAGHEFIIASRSQRQLDAVIVTYMREFAREHHMTFRKGESFFVMNSWLPGPPNKFYPLIGSDIASAEKASGITAAGALMDECHVMPQDVRQHRQRENNQRSRQQGCDGDES